MIILAAVAKHFRMRHAARLMGRSHALGQAEAPHAYLVRVTILGKLTAESSS